MNRSVRGALCGASDSVDAPRLAARDARPVADPCRPRDPGRRREERERQPDRLPGRGHLPSYASSYSQGPGRSSVSMVEFTPRRAYRFPASRRFVSNSPTKVSLTPTGCLFAPGPICVLPTSAKPFQSVAPPWWAGATSTPASSSPPSCPSAFTPTFSPSTARPPRVAPRFGFWLTHRIRPSPLSCPSTFVGSQGPFPTVLVSAIPQQRRALASLRPIQHRHLPQLPPRRSHAQLPERLLPASAEVYIGFALARSRHVHRRRRA